MTVYASPTATLTVECHNGAVWLCAVEHNHTELLAQFKSDAAVDRFKRLANQRDRYMHEAGRSGL